MKQRIFGLLVLAAVLLPVSASAQAPTIEEPQPQQASFFVGEIVAMVEDETDGFLKQEYTVKRTSGAVEQTVTVTQTPNSDAQRYRYAVGDSVVIIEAESIDEPLYFMVSHYRLPQLITMLVLFFVLTIVLIRKKALLALGGLTISIIIIAAYLLPQLIDGRSPLVIGVVSIIIIAISSVYVSHGFSKRTSLALGSLLLSLLIAGVLAWIFSAVANLSGQGTEEAYSLTFAIGQEFDLVGLLFIAVLIGALGVLDDITTSLVATVEQIHTANPSLSRSALYKKGITVGREHIISLINTLVLAYVGASLPLLVILGLDQQPLWVTLNSEAFSEELMRTLVGSAALILAVPLTTFIAARYYGGRSITPHGRPEDAR